MKKSFFIHFFFILTALSGSWYIYIEFFRAADRTLFCAICGHRKSAAVQCRISSATKTSVNGPTRLNFRSDNLANVARSYGSLVCLFQKVTTSLFRELGLNLVILGVKIWLKASSKYREAAQPHFGEAEIR